MSSKASTKLKVYELYKYEGITVEKLSRIFDVRRSTIYRWIRQVKKAKTLRRYQYLEPRSRKPRRLRQPRKLTWEIKELILRIRKECKCDKDKIKMYLRRDYGIDVGATTIYRFLKGLDKDQDPMYRNKMKRRSKKGGKKKDKNRISKVRYKDIKVLLKGRSFELIQMDVKQYNALGNRYYIFSAIDTVSRYAYTYGYSSHSSRGAWNFLRRLEIAFNLDKIDRPIFIQCDNGS